MGARMGLSGHAAWMAGKRADQGRESVVNMHFFGRRRAAVP
jgi:hypothetical protein